VRPFVPRNWSRKLLVVSTYYERPDTTSGRMILTWATEAGYAKTDVALMGALRCRKQTEEKPSMTSLRGCRSYVVQAIQVLKPERILVMGDAWRSLINKGTPGKIMEHRGLRLPIPGTDRWCYVTHDPETKAELQSHIVTDMQRFTWPVLEWPGNDRPDAWVIGVDTEFDTEGRLLDIACADKETAFCWSLSHAPKA